MESIFAGLFGYWPTPNRRDMWSGFLTTPEISIKCNVAKGLLGVVRSRVGDTPKLDVSLDGERVSDKTQPTKIQPYVTSMVGGPDTWLRSSFLAQDPQMDMVELGPADRLVALQRLLGLDEVEALAKALAQATKTAEAILGSLESSKQQWVTLGDAITQHTERLAAATQDAAQAETALIAVRYTLDTLETKRATSAAAQEVIKLEADVATGPADSVIAAAQEREQLARDVLNKAVVADQEAKQLSIVAREGVNSASLLCKVGCADKLLPCPLIDKAVQAKAAGEKAANTLQTTYATAPDVREEAHKIHREALASLSALQTAGAAVMYARPRLARLRESLPVGAKPITPEECQQLTAAQQQLGVLEASRRQACTLRDTLKGSLDTMQARRQELDLTLLGHEKAKHRVATLRVLTAAFSRSGIPKILVCAAIPGIQEEINSILAYPGMGWLRLDLDYPTGGSDAKAVPTPLASVRGGPWVDARLLSGGQRAVARLVLRLASCAWACKTSGASVLFLDEPTAAISEDVSLCLSAVLKDMVGPGKPFLQAILATHDPALANTLGGSVQRV
jgi:DNA repair exonuclease SbcCD ATPase subunit